MTEQALVRPPAIDFDHQNQDLAPRIHDVYRELRGESPLQWSEHYGGFWIATGYEPIQDIAQAPSRFTSDGALIPDTMDGNALVPQMLEDPDHRLYRTLLRDWFTPRRIGSFESELRAMAAGILENLQAPADLSTEFALPLPMRMILKVIGVQEQNMDPIREGVQYMVDHAGQDTAGATDAWQSAMDFVKHIVLAPLRDQPGDDLLSYLLTKQDEIEQLTDDMIAAIGFSMIGAGFDTTYKTLSSSLAFLASNPDAQAKARTAPSSAVVEEMLRMFAPVAAGRRVQADTVVAGQRLRAGDRVLLAYPAANRDPAEFSDPDTARFERNNNRHLTFGTGIHRCLGMHLARLEMRVAIEEVLSAFTEFHLAPGEKASFVQSQVWGAVSVPVVFTRT